ncbi:hypothetical protein [uncultured Tenacibaculum sp.]|uniref:hypothetical protein n=1 Tax=uncultured Tenacibaculum sp. TaxID=174713 RepID=UPI0026356FAE|nr:hypothetical protein [uncultured Tenacibaculum sp.]
MKIFTSFLLTILFTSICFGQEQTIFKVGEEFNSVFQDLKNGVFNGSVNGILIVKKNKQTELIFDFQGSESTLNILPQEEEVYDVSTKSYLGKTTSGRTEIKYETYAYANGIGIKLNGQWFELSAIDGACDMVINGLDYSYHSESSAEYLVIKINKELELNNWRFLIRTEHKTDPNNIHTLMKKKKSIKVLPNSTIVFAIKRK